MKVIFFSIVIPAHNEEQYIGNSLKSLISQNYPRDRYEILVVENGSTDRTLEAIKKVKSKLIKPFSLKQRGISLAKNFGAAKASKKSEWLIFLDADTSFEKNVLSDINEYLNKNNSKNLSIGTIKVLSLESGFINDLWFHYWDLVHKFMKMSASVQIVKKKLFSKVKYDEELKQSEDVELLRAVRKFGRFFYIPAIARASSRRFKKVGGIKLLFNWMWVGILPHRLKKVREYEVVR